MDWFMEQIGLGRFEVQNPYNGKTSFIPVTPDNTHTIVFWSKNFGPFLKGGYGQKLNDMGFHLFFNFTVNSHNRILEPNLPPLDIRLKQLKSLADMFGSESIFWRFDPICHYRTGAEETNNLNDFYMIAGAASESNIRTCITSFLDIYPKINRRKAPIQDFSFFEPGDDKKIDILLKMNKTLSGLGISLKLCCEHQCVESLPDTSGISAASCIPNDLLVRLYGGRVSTAKDSGQRQQKGCGCKTSSDIGSYRHHVCRHNCLYCYATPENNKRQP